MPKKRIIFAAGLMTLYFSASAAAAPAEFQFSLAFSPALPTGSFHDALDMTVWGGSLSFAFRPSGSPVLIGTSLVFGAYDTDHWEAWLGLTDPDVLVDVRTTNGLLAWNLFLRFQPERGFLRPYLDLFAGLHVLTTTTQIGEGDSDDADGDFDVNNASIPSSPTARAPAFSFPSSASSIRRGGGCSRSTSTLALDMPGAARLTIWSKREGRGPSIRGPHAPTC